MTLSDELKDLYDIYYCKIRKNKDDLDRGIKAYVDNLKEIKKYRKAHIIFNISIKKDHKISDGIV